MTRIAGEEEFEVMADLADAIEEFIPVTIDTGLVAGALGMVLGKYMEASFAPKILMDNMMQSSAAIMSAAKEERTQH